ncbi:MAG: Polysaccharide biosynthesis protein [Ignavibacteriae bacterium]|nr:MAG: Polysaccharide biosynthesis protein [Ignavibacteriota bacterium]
MSIEEFKPPERFPQKIVKNTIYNIIGNFTLLIIGFILVPYIIKHIGVNVYGNIWVVAIIIISFSQLFDFGFGSTCTKYVAEYHTKAEILNLNKIINSVLFFFLILWIIIFPLIVFFKEEIVLLLGTSADLKSEMYFVLFITTGIVAVNHITSPFYASINAIQRYDLLNIAIISGAIFNLILIIILFNTGFGVNGLAVSYFLFYLLIAISVTVYSFKLLPGLKINFKYVSIETLKKVFSFGTNLQINRIAQVLVFQLDKFLVLKFFGGNYAAYYEIGTKITGFARSIPLLLVSAVVPAASELDAKGEKLKLNILFETGTRYLIIGGLLIGGFIFTHANLLIQSWVGKKLTVEGISIASSIIRLIILGYFANMITGAMSSIALGFDRTDFERRAGIITIIMFPISVLIFLPYFGFWGIPISVAFTIIVSAVYYMLTFVRFVDYRFQNILIMLIKPFITTVVSGFLTYLLFQIFPVNLIEKRIGGIIAVSVLFLFYFVIFSGSIIFLKGYTNTDLLVLKMFIEKLRSVKSKI